MSKLSIIIPSRNEPLLKQTVDDIFKNAAGDIEVIVVLDGPTQFPVPEPHSRIKYIRKDTSEGLRSAVNDAAKIAEGTYIMKTDAHVAFSPGFDTALQKDMEDNWIAVPQRYDLDIELWQPKLDTLFEYYYLGFPFDRRYFVMADMVWPSRTKERANIMIDDLMTYGGTVWFTSLKHFMKLGGMNSVGYGTFIAESQELGMKTWLGGGRVIINKNVWYAHYGEGHSQRPFKRGLWDSLYGCVYSAHFWTENRWPDRVHDFEWLIEKFWPLPTPENSARREKYPWPEKWKSYFEAMSTETLSQIESFKKTPPTSELELIQCIDSLNYKTGAVVGVGDGNYSEALCSSIRHLKLYCIDLWPTNNSFELAEGKLDRFDTKLINKKSIDAAKDFPAQSLDFVFIDMSDTSKDIKNALDIWRPKVKNNGIVSYLSQGIITSLVNS